MDPVLIGEILAGTMFLGVIGFLMLGFPVAFTLAGTWILFALTGLAFGVFDMSNLGSLAGRYTGYMTNEVLVAVPLFIFMGVMLERSNIAKQLLSTMGKLFGNMRGGLRGFRRGGGRIAGGIDRRGRRHGGDDGADFIAGDDAGGV